MPGERIKQSKFMQRCVADVTGQGRDTAGAFAICTAQSQKAGYAEPGSRTLTAKGKRRERQFGKEKDMPEKRAAYMAATGRAEEAAGRRDWTWKNVNSDVVLAARRAKLDKWEEKAGQYVVFKGGSKWHTVGFVTLVNVGETSRQGEHAGHFMLQVGLPEALRDREDAQDEDAAESKKVFAALVDQAERLFAVKRMARVADLEGYRAAEEAATTVRGMLEALEESTGRPAKAPREVVKALAKFKGLFKGILFDREAEMDDQAFADAVREYAWLADRWTDEEIGKDPRQAALAVRDVMRERDRYADDNYHY